jgi:N-glycosylase/DNA lyase
MKRSRYRNIKELQTSYLQHKDAIQARLGEFAAISPDRYFYELAYCLLTPQSSATRAAAAVAELERIGFLESDTGAARVLRRKSWYIRFHNTKARWLSEARDCHKSILAELSNGTSAGDLRLWLIRNVQGLGWKEASHFLRNIGYRELAILDRHILRNLKKHGVIRTIPAALTGRQYLVIENKFKAFAREVDIPLDELDLLFWSMETGEILK